MNGVSVVIPTFNRSGPLRRSLASVFAQTVAPIEVIVVDDASSDDTAAVMAGLQAPIPVTYVRFERNRGGGAARNAGIDRARGDYVALLDSDDEWRPDHLERHLAHAAGRSGDFLQGSSSIHIRGERSTPRRYDRDFEGRAAAGMDFILKMPMAFQSSTLFAPAATWRGLRFDERFRRHQDWDLAFLALARGIPLRIWPDTTSTYVDSGTAGVGLSAKLMPSLRFLVKHGAFISTSSRLRFATLQVHRRRKATGRYFAALVASFLTGAIGLKEFVFYGRECLLRVVRG